MSGSTHTRNIGKRCNQTRQEKAQRCKQTCKGKHKMCNQTHTRSENKKHVKYGWDART